MIDGYVYVHVNRNIYKYLSYVVDACICGVGRNAGMLYK